MSSSVLPIEADPGVSDFRLDAALAREAGAHHAASYQDAAPFPHVVLDDFLPAPIATALSDRFPAPHESSRQLEEVGGSFLKRQFLPADLDDRFMRAFFDLCNSEPMLAFVEALTGIDGLLPDPYFEGGGLHEIERGGSLGIHADFRIHDRLNLLRRVNLLVYLNPHWELRFGGELELWSDDMTSRVQSVAPLHNRCVVFTTDDRSFHGHPEPLATPPGVTRRSIALYYYTASEALRNEVPHYSTVYRSRPGDDAVTRRRATALRARSYANDWVPPAARRLIARLRQTVFERSHH